MATEKNLQKLVRDSNRRAERGRIERLHAMISAEDPHPAPVSALAHEYYEEARLCWYMGAFVSTIVMTQLAFEELLRSHYRLTKGVGGKLSGGKKVDDGGFADLIEEARGDHLISVEEATTLHVLRREFRNPFVHPHDVKAHSTPDEASAALAAPTDFLMQLVKIVAPQLVDREAEGEAKEAVTLLVTAFREISRRCWGMRTC